MRKELQAGEEVRDRVLREKWKREEDPKVHRKASHGMQASFGTQVNQESNLDLNSKQICLYFDWQDKKIISQFCWIGKDCY